ncbi:MAG: dihydrofolate reductase [Polyangiales bacterium]|jgi:dihydrofolate reductase
MNDADEPSQLAPLELVVAVGQQGLIGSSEGHLGLPWHIPEDLKHFRRLTTGRPIIMGRSTFEAIGRPLPKRRNLVLSRSATTLEGVEVFADLDSALTAARVDDAVPIIIGGASVYAEALPFVTTIYLTHVDRAAEGDVYFPSLGDHFVEVERRASSTPDVVFSVLRRRSSPLEPS